MILSFRIFVKASFAEKWLMLDFSDCRENSDFSRKPAKTWEADDELTILQN